MIFEWIREWTSLFDFLHHFSEGDHLVHGVYQERGAFITRYLWGRGKLIDTGHFLEIIKEAETDTT